MIENFTAVFYFSFIKYPVPYLIITLNKIKFYYCILVPKTIREEH